MVGEPSAAVLAACRREAIGAGFSFEMFEARSEAASSVFTSSAEAADYLRAVRGNLAQSLAEFGLGVVCAGSHPLADWRGQRPTDQAHFRQLFDDIQYVARRSVLCGLHVHVQVPQTLDRIAVMNRVSPWLPLLLLLSCSSPFWDGAPSGFMSYRQAACDEWPRMGVPEHFSDWAEYQRYLAMLQRIDAIKADGNGWWGIRPAARCPTLELRMTDACPRLADALALATLFRVMVTHACAMQRPGAGFSAEARWLLRRIAGRPSVMGPLVPLRWTTPAPWAALSNGCNTPDRPLPPPQRPWASRCCSIPWMPCCNAATARLSSCAGAPRPRPAAPMQLPACAEVVDLLLAQTRGDH